MKSPLLSAALAAVVLPLAAQAATHQVAALSDLAGVNKALRVKAGDTVSLPVLSEGSYKVTNARYAELGQDGATLTILEPGMLGVQQLAADGTTIVTTGAILVVPDAIGSGRVFVWNPTHWDSANWCTSESPVWTIVEGEGTASDYPCRPNDIAILPRYGDWAYEINVSQDISLGGLMMGSYMLDKNMWDYKYTIRGKDGAASTITFSRTDGEPAWIQFCPNGNSTGDTFWQIRPSFGESGRPIVLRCASDVDLDLGWDGTDSRATLARLLLGEGCTLSIDEDRTFTITHGSPRQDGAFFSNIEFKGAIAGAGTFANRCPAAVRFDANGTAFTGCIVEAGPGRDSYDRNAQTFFLDSDTLDNAALTVEGYVTRQTYRDFLPAQAAGYARFGMDHTWPGQNEIGNRLPGRAVVLNGGRLELHPEQQTWSEGAKVRYETDFLAVSNGFSYVDANGRGDTASPEVAVSMADGLHANNATLYLRSNRMWIKHGEYCERITLSFPWMKNELVGGIIPWFASHDNHPEYGDWMAMRFPSVDEDGFLYMPNYPSGDLSGFAAGANAFCDGTSLRLTEDLTVNSLTVQNSWNGDRKIGTDRTLTISSGGLILNGNTRIGENDWNQAEPAADCGTLAFGAKAYVWANSQNAANPNIIMATIVAPYGFVFAYPGYLHLVGDQTGIDGELVVNAGELTLGIGRNMNGVDLDLGCTIDVPVRLVGGGAKLIVRKAGSLDPTQPIFFEDIGGYAGKIELPAGEERCRECYVDGVTIPRGTWGATGSGAEHIDDAHFAGTGVLKVARDNLVRPTFLLIH